MFPDVVHEGRPIDALVVEEGVHICLERAAVALHDSEVVVEGDEGVARVPGHVHNLEHAMGGFLSPTSSLWYLVQGDPSGRYQGLADLHRFC